MVAIKDLKMPKSCSQCSFWDVYGKCMACGNFVEDTDGSRFVDCPLLESKENMVAMLDKIRAEIANHCGVNTDYCDSCRFCTDSIGVREILQIIDKYKADRSVEDE